MSANAMLRNECSNDFLKVELRAICGYTTCISVSLSATDVGWAQTRKTQRTNFHHLFLSLQEDNITHTYCILSPGWSLHIWSLIEKQSSTVRNTTILHNCDNAISTMCRDRTVIVQCVPYVRKLLAESF